MCVVYDICDMLCLCINMRYIIYKDIWMDKRLDLNFSVRELIWGFDRV